MALAIWPELEHRPALAYLDADVAAAANSERLAALSQVDLWDLPWTVVDIETTGSIAGRDGITEIALVTVDAGRITNRWRSLVNPCQPIPPFITQLTGITDEMVAGAPCIGRLLPRIAELIGDRVLAGHNVRFDAGFLDRELGHHGFQPLSNIQIDTLALARRTIAEVPNYKLGTLTRELGIDVERHHRALADATATAHLLVHCVKKLEDCAVFTLSSLFDFLRVRRSKRRRSLSVRNLPDAAQLPVWTSVLINELDQAPAKPGVYTLRDAANNVVYIGKSRSLRDRLRAYASLGKPAGAKIRALRSVVASFEYTVTGSELEALLLEAELVRLHDPPFNDRLRHFRQFAFIKVEHGPHGRIFATTRLTGDGAHYYGPYHSMTAARAAAAALQDALGLHSDDLEPGDRTLPPAQRAALLEEAAAFIEGRGDDVLLAIARRRDEAAARAKAELASREEERLERLRRLRSRQESLAFATGLHAVVMAAAPEPSEEACFLFCGGRLAAQGRLPRRLPERQRARDLLKQMLCESFQPHLMPRSFAKQQEIDQLHIFANWYRDRREGLYYAELPNRAPQPEEAERWAGAILDGESVVSAAGQIPENEDSKTEQSCA